MKIDLAKKYPRRAAVLNACKPGDFVGLTARAADCDIWWTALITDVGEGQVMGDLSPVPSTAGVQWLYAGRQPFAMTSDKSMQEITHRSIGKTVTVRLSYPNGRAASFEGEVTVVQPDSIRLGRHWFDRRYNDCKITQTGGE